MERVLAHTQHNSKPQRTRQEPNAFNRKVAFREFPKRHIYFILDGSDLNLTSVMSFVLAEVNECLCRLISDKVWHSEVAQKTEDFYAKVELCEPSFRDQGASLLQ
jgi:hypothetical protein